MANEKHGDRLKAYIADLHVHTVLSPCAAVEMIPPFIIQEALARRIDIIAVADHNASANVAAMQRAAHGTGLTVLPGMELQTREEVHVLCLFETSPQLEAWQDVVDAHLPQFKNDAEFFGEQFVVDETGDFIRLETRLLLTSVSLVFEEAIAQVTALGGLAIPAHVDRPTYSVLANLGFVPRDAGVEALEISRHVTPKDVRHAFPDIADYPLIQSGDVHFLGGLLGSTVFTLAAPTLAEIRLALQGREGRRCRIVTR